MLEVITVQNDPDHILRRQAERISDPTSPEMRTLVSEMIETMRREDGVGLAAPQIGRSVRLFVIETAGRVSVFFNPNIVSYSEETIMSEEGCLSVPGEFSMIDRSKRISMEYQDTDGKKKTFVAEDFLATVLQHEYDHLDGKLMIDRVR